MATTWGPYGAGTGSQEGGGSWSNPTNITAEDATYASHAVSWDGEAIYQTVNLFATNFSSASEIPTSATLQGITVEVKGYDTASASMFCRINPFYNGVDIGNENNTGALPASNGWATAAGSSTNIWGLSSTYLNNLNNIWSDPLFGFGIRIHGGNALTGSGTVYIDHVRVTFYVKTQQDPSETITISETVTVTSTAIAIGTVVANNMCMLFDFNNMLSNDDDDVVSQPSASLIGPINIQAAAYSDEDQTMWAGMSNKGQVVDWCSGDTFDGTAIDAYYTRGYSKFDANTRKNTRFHYCTVASGDDLTLTVYSDNDASSQDFTISPTTQNGTTVNPSVVTPLSSTIHAVNLSTKVANTNGCYFLITDEELALLARTKQ